MADKISPSDLGKLAKPLGEAAKKLFLEELPEGAATLLAIDRAIQTLTNHIDKAVADAVKLMPKRTAKDIDQTCELKSGALPVSKSLKAVHYGALRIAFRVLPRMVENFLVKEFSDFIGKTGAFLAGQTIRGITPVIAGVASAGIGIADATKFYNELEDQIHEVLGCKSNEMDSGPMRFSVNELISEMKNREELLPRVKKKVHTRRKD